MIPMKYPPRRPHGYALIIVLFVTVLCALMVVILMERNTGSLKSASAYRQVAQVRSLSDMAMNVVQAQIRDATTTNQMPTTALASRDTWASQPGAIRVFTPAGTLRNIYKLYSSDTMQTTDAALAADVPTNWFSRKSEFTDMNDPVVNGALTNYPIVNPSAAALNPTATGITNTNGFLITNAPVQTGTTNANPAPMPVRWIYVLEDGSLCQLGDARINKATNPIIGRIAFWTDDETCKVNLNTASPTTSASYWDVPRGFDVPRSGGIEAALALNQPAQNEYQRYPGHPAMVSLRPILGNLGGMSSASYFDITSRYRWGGSEDGTKDIKPTTTRTSLLTNKEDRAYATVDELLFQSQNSPTTLRPLPTADQIESLQFFLTTSSRAPELNLFGQPRVTIWPVSATNDATHRTPFDNLIAFSSTIGGKVYHFVRSNPLSPTADYTGFPRNQALYSYLQGLTSVPVPGFGGSNFASKYGADRDQILTEIFDYIRCTNLNETYQGRAAGFKSYTPELTGAGNLIGGDSSMAGAGFVVPIQIGTTRGGGRFPAIQGAGLWFVQHLQNPALVESASNVRMLQAQLVLKTTVPMCGFMPWEGAGVVFNNSNSVTFAVDGQPAVSSFPGGNSATINYGPLNSGCYDAASPGGYEGALWPTSYGGSKIGDLMTYFSQDIPVGSGTTFSIVGGTVDVSISVAGNVIQRYRFDFPGVPGLALPTVNPHIITNPVTGAFITYGDNAGGTRPWWRARCNFYGPLDGDVLRSVELSHGDARLALMAATSATSPYSDFTKHRDYSDATKAFAHSFRGGASSPFLWPGGTVGGYVQGLTYWTSTIWQGQAQKLILPNYAPDIPPTITDLRNQKDLNGKFWNGDFDNGVGGFSDGPFLNMPDEGCLAYLDPWGSPEMPYGRCLWTVANGLFSPLRQVPSAAMFGSLPTGVKANIPWRTLLFCPNPSAGNSHPGFGTSSFGGLGPKALPPFTTAPDHLLLDLFRMPVVEPYAMSGPASTDGKINMNYAIAPFSYIRRASSWYSLLEALKFFAVPDNESANYKGGTCWSPLRSAINIDATLSQFETRFAAGDIFHLATEICSLFLVPTGQTLATTSGTSATDFWPTHRLTGDNSREKPYAELYPKLTTQSNTYRVHMRVQILPKSDALRAGQADFVPLAEFRGSRLIERYLNPSDPRFSTVNPDTDNLNDLYQFRVLEARQFNP